MFLCLPVTMLPQSQENNSGQKLSEVAHDATLTGKGTNASPLSIANGAVTSTKLDTVNAPQTGQVLSFNGSALSWQTPTAPSGGSTFRVVDKFGSEVGLIVSTSGNSSSGNLSNVNSSTAARYISSSDTWIQFTVFKSGIGSPLSNKFDIFYEETNCQGQSFMTVGDSLFVIARIVGTDAYFPSGPGETRGVKSVGVFNNGFSCVVPGNGGVGQFVDLAPTEILPFVSFGTPPFKVVR